MDFVALKNKIDALPNRPGVYIMKDSAGSIIYVGKAVNLRHRVRNYFNRSSSDSRAFIQLLNHMLSDLEIVIVSTEKEAFLLENELIKKHRPRFNVQLRDDKNFLCLRLDIEHRYPRLETVRRLKEDGARYFGPYASAASIRETLRIVNRFFQLRTCSDRTLESRKRPCLLYQLHRCPAPCVFPVAEADYWENVEAVMLFLEGKSDVLLEALKLRMQEAVRKLEFEKAARLRNQMDALKHSLERQVIASTQSIDQDVFGLYREGDRVTIYALCVRAGRVSAGGAHHCTSQFPNDELMTSFMNQYYAHRGHIPEEILLPFTPNEAEPLVALLTEHYGRKTRMRVPRRGDKVELVKLALSNAQCAFQARTGIFSEIEAIQYRLQTCLHLKHVPRRVECFDVSHHHGTSIVASQVASLDDEFDYARYRHYKLKSVTQNDDFASIYEVLTRRLSRGDLPDLMIVDGGKGQLSAAKAAMQDVGVHDVDLIALAKSRTQGTHTTFCPERVFLVDRKEAVILPPTSSELLALMRIRDEAHRFAITFQRKVSGKRSLRSELDRIPGVGEARRKALLRYFGSVKQLKGASLEELIAVDGVGIAVAKRLHAFLHIKEACRR